jgi:hypothetical protein
MRQSISAPVRLTGLVKVQAGRFTGGTGPDVVGVETSTGKLWLYPGTASGAVLDRRVEIGRGGWNGFGHLAAGDFTGDGRADVVGVETSTGKLWLYPNSGQAGLAMLAARVEIGRAGWNALGRLVGGDYTGDGRADLLAVETATGKLWSYRNSGQSGLATLAPRAEIGRSSWQTMSDLAAGDFTGDGRVDLFAVTGGTGTTWIYPGDGTGTTPLAGRTEVRQIA